MSLNIIRINYLLSLWCLLLLSPVMSIISKPATAMPTDKGGAEYTTECAMNGVPLPPDWGSGQWVYNGDVEEPLIAKGLKAKVYYYRSSSPAGLCFALPRVIKGTTEAEALAVICQGKVSGKVCFWDNNRIDNNVPTIYLENNYVIAETESKPF